MLHHQPRCIRAHVAKALDNHAASVDGHIQVAEALIADNHHAAACRFHASARSADVQRLARNNARHGLAHMHGVGVHDPGHRLLVGVYIRRGHIFFRPDEVDDLRGIPARHALQFAMAHLLGVADHSALGSAKRNVYDRALPGHPARQRTHFVERDLGCVADAALARTACNGVLYPESGKNLDAAVVHGHRKVNDNFARGRPQQLPKPFIQIELACREIKPRALRFPGVNLLVQCHCCWCHTISNSLACRGKA